MNISQPKTFTSLLCAALTLVVCQSTPSRAAQSHPALTDLGITSAVEAELLFAKGISVNSIDVKSDNGIVTLSGTTHDLLTRERARRVAESIRGVRAVVNRIVVTPAARPDEAIRKDVLLALLQDPATESYQVAVAVQNGLVTLTGTVGSWAELQLTGRIAEGVKGVKAVTNNIVINYLSKRTDTEIVADVKAALQWDIWVNGYLIDSKVKDSVVSLTGTVGSVAEKNRAMDVAWVNGVTNVDASGLLVEPWARDEAQRNYKFVEKPDADILQAILAAFHADPRVKPFAVSVNVDGGVVLLTGVVGNLKAKISAVQDAKNTVGVEGVDNFLKVRPNGKITDADATTALKAALFWDPLLSDVQLDVAVLNHVAYLSGTVDAAYQRSEAQDIAARTKGVVEVRDRLKTEPEETISYADWPYYVTDTFGPPPLPTDAQIKQGIERAMLWSPFVDRDEITVTVQGGVATLTGKIGGWVAYGEAERDAYKGGATGVINKLQVKKGAWF